MTVTELVLHILGIVSGLSLVGRIIYEWWDPKYDAYYRAAYRMIRLGYKTGASNAIGYKKK